MITAIAFHWRRDCRRYRAVPVHFLLADAMTATLWYLLGCATGAGCTLIVVLMGLVAVWPDLKTRFRGRG